MNDPLIRFAEDDRVIVTDGGDHDRCKGTVEHVLFLRDVGFVVRLEDDDELLVFADWQLEPYYERPAVEVAA